MSSGAVALEVIIAPPREIEQAIITYGRNRLKTKDPWAEQIEVPVPTFMGPIGALVHRVWAAVHQLGVSRGRAPQGIARLPLSRQVLSPFRQVRPNPIAAATAACQGTTSRMMLSSNAAG